MKTLNVLSLTMVSAITILACGSYAPLPAPNELYSLDCDGGVSLTLDQLTRDAIGADKTKAENAIRALRARGPEGLRALLEANAAILSQRSVVNRLATSGQPDDDWLRVKAALDGVSGQRDCSASHLYWYTDFEQAKVAAKGQGKPILSLRLLGKLDEEFSCANSRFFRTTLYANTEVSRYLRDHFILHWKSVRPVPRVTIDFGDGRKLERTITGNSIHYVLAADGRVIDAFPGLYGPKAFMQGLRRAKEITKQTAAVDAGQRTAMLAEYHQTRIATLNAEFKADLQSLSAPAPLDLSFFMFASSNPLFSSPTVHEASQLATSKFQVEQPILNKTLPRSAQNENSPAGIDDATWSRLAALHQDNSRLDAPSREMIRAKNPTAFDARRAAYSKTIVEDPLLRQIRNLERSISEDTVRNEYLLHPKIHAWLANGEMTNVDELNRKVYAELFLTPDSDPWLGLAPTDTYTALENNGVAGISANSKTATSNPIGL